MWVAKNKNGVVNLYYKRPTLKDGYWLSQDGKYFAVDSNLFPKKKSWEIPIEVKLEEVIRHYIQCDWCGRAFSYLPEDTKTISQLPYPNATYEDYFEVVQCPHCKKEVYT